MKRIILMSVFALCSIAFGEITLKGLQNDLAMAKTDSRKTYFMTKIEVLKANPNSFSDVVKICHENYKKSNADPHSAIALSCEIGVWWYDGKFIREAFDYARKEKCGSEFHVAYRNKVSISHEERADILAEYVMKKDFSAYGVNADNVLDVVREIVNELTMFEDESKALNLLKKMNRVLSPRLLKDKTVWEPPVALIRTALETY